jgi:phosphoribosylformylglycinamidine synthase I
MAARIGITVFPGSNCDRDVYHVLNNLAGIKADFIWHNKDRIGDYEAMIIPGGFAFGDRLRAGIIAAHSPIMKEVKRMAKDGIPVLGICNGFQILVESGLLPGALIANDSLRFVCKLTEVEVVNNKTPFTGLFALKQKFNIPIAHGEGRYVADRDKHNDLKKKNQIVMRYSAENPNGSDDLIAAICNEEGNVMGMMPHPERAAAAAASVLTANRASTGGSSHAIKIFWSLLSHLKQKAIA